jgi:hypothetical protein
MSFHDNLSRQTIVENGARRLVDLDYTMANALSRRYGKHLDFERIAKDLGCDPMTATYFALTDKPDPDRRDRDVKALADQHKLDPKRVDAFLRAIGL